MEGSETFHLQIKIFFKVYCIICEGSTLEDLSMCITALQLPGLLQLPRSPRLQWTQATCQCGVVAFLLSFSNMVGYIETLLLAHSTYLVGLSTNMAGLGFTVAPFCCTYILTVRDVMWECLQQEGHKR